MTTGALITMCIVLTAVWGGFVTVLLWSMRKKQKEQKQMVEPRMDTNER